jgi:hypothetical protein
MNLEYALKPISYDLKTPEPQLCGPVKLTRICSYQMHSLYFGSWILKSIRWCITCYLIRSALGYSQSGPQKDI